MSDYISREDAVDDLHTQLMYRMGTDDMKRRLDDWVKTLPSADVAPVRHGKWTHKPDVYGVVYCSECNYELHANSTSFCPNCGAKMDGEE